MCSQMDVRYVKRVLIYLLRQIKANVSTQTHEISKEKKIIVINKETIKHVCVCPAQPYAIY